MAVGATKEELARWDVEMGLGVDPLLENDPDYIHFYNKHVRQSGKVMP